MKKKQDTESHGFVYSKLRKTTKLKNHISLIRWRHDAYLVGRSLLLGQREDSVVSSPLL